jgi:hypothetical protein
LLREITAMSDYGDFGHVETGHENQELEHGQQAYGQEHDASQAYDAYGQENHYENDQHYNHGEHVAYHSPDGGSYEKTEFTNFDSHVEESDAAYGEHFTAHEHDASFGQLDYLRQYFDADFARGDFGDFAQDSGQQELSAASN